MSCVPKLELTSHAYYYRNKLVDYFACVRGWVLSVIDVCTRLFMCVAGYTAVVVTRIHLSDSDRDCKWSAVLALDCVADCRNTGVIPVTLNDMTVCSPFYMHFYTRLGGCCCGGSGISLTRKWWIAPCTFHTLNAIPPSAFDHPLPVLCNNTETHTNSFGALQFYLEQFDTYNELNFAKSKVCPSDIFMIEHERVTPISSFGFIRYLGPINPLKQNKKNEKREIGEIVREQWNFDVNMGGTNFGRNFDVNLGGLLERHSVQRGVWLPTQHLL
jgi:hypothetical protein